MNFLSNPLVARLLWAGPLLLLVIAGALLRAGLAQRAVAAGGIEVPAVVDSLAVRERAEITRGAAYLRYTPPGEAAPVRRAVELPLSFLKELEGREGETITLRVRPGTDQIVLAAHGRAQWMMTLSFAAMALLGAIGLGWLVAAWNRLLAREGDPATRSAAA